MAKSLTITLSNRAIGSVSISNREIGSVTLVDVVGTSGFDADALVFFSAGDFNATEKTAINTLVLDFKGQGSTPNSSDLWTDVLTGYSVWPFAGSTAANQALDLMRNNDLTFVNSPTFASTGCTLNSSSQYARTGINANTGLINDNVSMSVYLKSNATQNNSGYAIGAFTSSSSRLDILGRNTTDQSVLRAYASVEQVAGAARAGLSLLSRRSSSDMEAYINGTSIGNYTTPVSSVAPSLEVYIGCLNNGGSANNFLSSDEFRFAHLAKGMTDAQAADFYDAVERFQDNLSRGVN